MKNFFNLFVNELKRLYSAEKQILKALPKMAASASNSKLKAAFRRESAENKMQIRRLEEIAKELDINLRGPECRIVRHLLNERGKALQAHYDSFTKDAFLINHAQRIKHYEIVAYGILKAYARHLNLPKIEKLLERSAKEEGRENKKLTELAEGTIFTLGINVKACEKWAA